MEIRSKEWIEQDKALFHQAIEGFIAQYKKPELLRELWENFGDKEMIIVDEGFCGWKGTQRLHEMEMTIHRHYKKFFADLEGRRLYPPQH